MDGDLGGQLGRCIGGPQQDFILEDTQQIIKPFHKYKYLGM